MKNTPTFEQVSASKSWTDLYDLLGLHRRNTRAQKKVQEYVIQRWPDHAPKFGRPKRISDEEFTDIVARSQSTRAVIQACGWQVAGGAYTMVKDRVERLGLSTEHFLGQGHLSGKTHDFNSKPLDYYLVEDCYHINSHKLKLRLIKDGVKEHRCEICGITEWCGKPTPIALDHINGNRHDNRIINLRIVCPNCHAQTPTFAGRNRGKVKWSPPSDSN